MRFAKFAPLLITSLSCLAAVWVPLAVSCSSNKTTSSSAPALPAAARATLDKIISAMNQATSYKLESDVTNDYELVTDSHPGTDVTEWKGTRLFDVPSQEMGMQMTVTNGTIVYAFGEYIKDGYTYLQNVYKGNGSPWGKSKLNEIRWKYETQLPDLSEILVTAAGFSQWGDENINGTDCYVIDVTPTAGAMIDWIYSQEQSYGPSFKVMFGGGIPVVRQDAYNGGSVKIWVGTGSYLPLQVVFDTDFKGYVGGGPQPPGTYPPKPTTNLIDCSFHGELDFSGYNEPVNITLPPEALTAK